MLQAGCLKRFITNRINWYLEDRNLILEEQAGFRRNRSTIDEVVFFSQVANDALDQRNILTALYIEFKGAYDLIWREKLYQILHDIGVSGNMFKWIKSFTDQRIFQVRNGKNILDFIICKLDYQKDRLQLCII